MKIIGFGGSGHDWSVCILDNNTILAYADEDRLARIKYGIGSSLAKSRSLAYSLKTAEATPEDIDFAVGCDLVPLPLALPFRHRLVRIQHHLAHAYGAYFCSAFSSSAILISDNSGSPCPRLGFMGDRRNVETISYFQARQTSIEPIGNVVGNHVLQVGRSGDYYQIGETDNSLGHLYWIISEELGFTFKTVKNSIITEDGKTMGLAGYGDNRYVNELGEYLYLLNDGQIRINLTDGAFRKHIRHLLDEGPKDSADLQARRSAIAKAGQVLLESGILHAAKYLQAKTKERNLALAGGVALNCVANSKIAEEAGFEQVFVLPAAGDNGNALGAAIYGLVELAKYEGPMNFHDQLPFIGPYFEKPEMESAFNYAIENGALEVNTGPANDEFEFVANQLAEGKVVAWYEGRSEFGPRALGHRSIFADPRLPTMQDRINNIVKRRENFRPFAPMVLESCVGKYFDFDKPSPFMLFVGRVRPEWRDLLPAVIHVDGTARIQTINEDRYPSSFRLISKFAEITDIPILLNTSFNRSGEPLVESPMDAVKCFLETEIDLLYLEGYLLAKQNSNE